MGSKSRFGEIRQKLLTEREVKIAELAAAYQVTEETIRRDLEKLVNEGIAARTYGGAVLNQNNIVDKVQFSERSLVHSEEKKRIGELALPLIPEHVSIGTDGSTTVIALLKLLSGRKSLTLITNSVRALLELEKTDITMISTGGRVNMDSMIMEGAAAANALKNYHVDLALIGCTGLHPEEGAFDSNEADAELKSILIAQASEVILMLDHTKFGRRALVHLADFDQIGTIVTDERPSEEWLEVFEAHHVRLICPEA